MGGYDSSQIADLVGLYILNMLTRIISYQQAGLYRDKVTAKRMTCTMGKMKKLRIINTID